MTGFWVVYSGTGIRISIAELGIVAAGPDPESGVTFEVDPEFLERARRQDTTGGVAGGDQPDLPWDA